MSRYYSFPPEEPEQTWSNLIATPLSLSSFNDAIQRLEEQRQQLERLEEQISAGALVFFDGAQSNSEDQIETLVDLARQGDEKSFRELALAIGVSRENLDAFWLGACRRVRREA